MRKVIYNPFDKLTEAIMLSCLKSGKFFWIVQRFYWPDVPAGKGFIACPYDDFADASAHEIQLASREGKRLDIRSEGDKITNLLKPEQGFQVYINTLRQDWEKKMKGSFQKQFIAYIRTRTALAGKGPVAIEINLKMRYGVMVAELSNGEKSEDHDVYSIIK
ncbi:hypothetical protein AB6805_13805 [Chitinophaga sp. RCC_12]|uniref:hypothetical protein n=1 Tax=Chitinophaga sp. RCC_12 TaxID=3239226 RepID=UPI003523858A